MNHILKVIGFSLFGKDRLYYDYLDANVYRAAELLPDWTIRVYHDNSIDKSVICEKQCLEHKTTKILENQYYDNIDFCDVEKIPHTFHNTWNGIYMLPMSWRWLPIGDYFVDVFISRDTDSCIDRREQAAVQQWLLETTLFHIMRGRYILMRINYGNLFYSTV